MEKKRIIDARQREKFMVDDLFITEQAKYCGWKGTLVYIALCRHANKKQSCFPSIAYLAEELGTSTRTIIRGLKILEEKKLIKIEKTKKETIIFLMENNPSEEILKKINELLK